MTSLMAKRVVEIGAVFAFEPHPKTRARLEENVAQWNGCCLHCARVDVFSYTVSSSVGNSLLVEPASFDKHSGIARLSQAEKKGQSAHRVDTIIFDQWYAEFPPIRLVTIDVEGHEDEFLVGMIKSQDHGNIDFQFIGEMRRLPRPACKYLEGFGFDNFFIERNFLGPRLVATESCPSTLIGEATNVIAVREGIPSNQLQQSSWTCLHKDIAP
jgi:FkbM family methyltransferase